MEGILVPEDVQNIGPHYDRTLMAWWQNFNDAWPRLREKYGERFYRAWKYYLLISAAYFRTRQHNLFQVVATPLGAPQPTTMRATLRRAAGSATHNQSRRRFSRESRRRISR